MEVNVRSDAFRQRRHDATAEILIHAAQSAIARKGYERVTMRDIAAQAGCAPGTLYLYFKGKRDLVNALLERHMSLLHQELMEAIAATRDPLEKLRQLSRTLLEYFNQNRDVFKVFYSSTRVTPSGATFGLPRSVQEIERDLKEKEIEIIRQAQKRGQVRPDFPPESIQSFRQGLTLGLLEELSAREELPSEEEQMRMLWGFQTAGIGAGNAPLAPKTRGTTADTEGEPRRSRTHAATP
jgi:TetR/AcrR family transcriptional regulator, fatty acid metabolism regulator protein